MSKNNRGQDVFYRAQIERDDGTEREVLADDDGNEAVIVRDENGDMVDVSGSTRPIEHYYPEVTE